MAKNISVFGIYPDRTTVADAIDMLQQAHYRASDIAVLLPDNSGSKDFAHVKETKAPEGAAGGVGVAAIVGAVIGWMIATGRVTVPGFEPLAATAPLIGALAGAAAFGAIGWLIGFLIGLTRPEYVARRYAGRLREGGILLSVHCDDALWRGQALKILKATGAGGVSSAPEAAADFAFSNRPLQRMPLGARDRR